MQGPDYSAFSRKVQGSDIAEFREQYPEDGSDAAYAWLAKTTLTKIIIIAVGVVAGLSVASLNGNTINVVSSITIILITLAIIVVVFILTRQLVRAPLENSVRRHWFALDNGFDYELYDTSKQCEGSVFQNGSHRVYRDIISAEDMEIGNYSYDIESGQDRVTYTWGYVQLRLSSPMPQMILDLKSNNTRLFGMDILSNLPVDFELGHKVRLEGNFSDVYDLYVPAGYEKDAFYVFTPDLMATLIDHGADCDIEIINDTLYLYFPYTLAATEQSFKKLYSIIDTVGEGIYDRTQRYRVHAS